MTTPSDQEESASRRKSLLEAARGAEEQQAAASRSVKRLGSESQKLAALVAEKKDQRPADKLPTDPKDPRTEIVVKLRRKLRRDPTMAEVLEYEFEQTRKRLEHELELASGKLVHREMDYDDVQRKADSLEREASRAKEEASRAKRAAAASAWSGRLLLALLTVAIIIAIMALSKPTPVPHYRVEAAAVVTGTSIINVVVVPDHSGKGFTLPVEYRIDNTEMESCSVAMVSTVRLLPNGKIQVVLNVPPGHDDRLDRCNFIPLHRK